MRDLRDVVRIVASTGLRSNELCRLRWEHVDLRSRIITIIPEKNMATRRVPFTKSTGILFRRFLQRQPNAVFVLGDKPRAVLVRVSKQLRQVASAVGTRPLSLHGLRQAFAVRWVNAGGSLVSLASVLGFRSVLTATRAFSPKDLLSIDRRELGRVESFKE